MPTKKILIAYTTNAGSTADVAQAVSEELGRDGAQVDVCRMEEVTTLEDYTAVVIGAPMIVGWHRAALKFVKTHQQALSRVPVAYFFTAVNLTQTGETNIDKVPVCLDPALAKPPQKANRLSFKERYALPANYLRPALKAAPLVKPVSVAFFNGKLELYRLKWWQVLFVLLVIQAKPGGYHNMPFIREWAAGLRAKLFNDSGKD
jgi:menaquinone-dependent protoporphyrinogen IX oxidase